MAAPLYYVSPGQINFQVPWATPTSGHGERRGVGEWREQQYRCRGGGNRCPRPVQSASGAAIVQNTPSYSLNDPSNPAPVGSTIVAYLTGTGPVSPAAKDGVPTGTNVLTNATSAVTAKIGSANATVSFTGLTPGFIGLAQMNIVVPPGWRPEFIR